MSIEFIYPNADYSIAAGVSKSGGTYWYENIDEIPANDDTDYIYKIGVGSADALFDCPDPVNIVAADTIDDMHISGRCKYIAPNISSIRFMIRTHDTVYYGTSINLTDAYTDYNQQWSLNPYTNAAWTLQELKDMQIGISLNGAAFGGTARCTQLNLYAVYIIGVSPAGYTATLTCF